MPTDDQFERAIDSLLGTTEETAEAPPEEATETDMAEEAEGSDLDEAQAEGAEGEAEVAELDADDAEEDDEGEEQPKSYRVKVDGREVEVTLEDLTRSYSGQAYIQKGMQENAAIRRELEQKFQTLQVEQQQFLAAAQRMQAGEYIAPPKMPSPELAQTDPIGYMQERSRYDAQLEAYNQQQAQITQVQERQKALQQQAMSQYLDEQRQALREAIPEYADPKAGDELRRKMADTGKSVYGFSDEEISGITDARAVKVLHDAMRYRELIEGKAKAKKPAKKPANVRPKARTQTPQSVQREQMRQKARKTGKVDDFVDLLLVQKSG